jgi:predicted nucleotidyltransferase
MTLELANRRLEDSVSRRVASQLRAFRHDVDRRFPGRVSDVLLFGSRARGDARRGSDYDVAVFLRALEDRSAIDHVLSDLAYRYVLAGYHISPVALPSDFLHRTSHPLGLALLREGIPVL